MREKRDRMQGGEEGICLLLHLTHAHVCMLERKKGGESGEGEGEREEKDGEEAERIDGEVHLSVTRKREVMELFSIAIFSPSRPRKRGKREEEDA